MARKQEDRPAALRKELVEREPGAEKPTGAVRGVLSGLNPEGVALVDFCGNTAGGPLPAVATVPVRPEDIGKEAVLLFEDGDPQCPLLIGLVVNPASEATNTAPTLDVKVDGRTLILQAEQEISIRCGDASITLTRAGKVLIKGTYLLSRSTGPNRIKGGSIHLN
jgi:hypothetical protein